MGVWRAIANKMEASQETCFFFFFFFWGGGGGGKNNPGLFPDYQMVCCIHIECLESLGKEIGKKLH